MAHTRRPFCPYCRYDLSGTVRPGSRLEITCSECGNSFMPDELGRRKLPDEWSLSVGLRRLGMSVAMRTLLVIALELGLYWLLYSFAWSLGNQVGQAVLDPRRLFWPTAFMGLPLGFIMIWRLSDIAGFESLIVIIAALAGMVGASLVVLEILGGPIAPAAFPPTPIVGVMTASAVVFMLWYQYHYHS